MTDKERIYAELLALRCRRGDREALAELVEHWERRLLYFVRRLVDDEQEAWDVLQETWLGVFRGIKSLNDGACLSTWLYRVARNNCVNHLRKKMKLREMESGNIPVDDFSEEVSDHAFEDADLVHRSLDKLPLLQREVITLFFLEDMSIAEMSSVLDVPPGTVKSRLFTAKRTLRKIVERGAHYEQRP